jgi:hypothetical protein
LVSLEKTNVIRCISNYFVKFLIYTCEVFKLNCSEYLCVCGWSKII